MAVFPSAYFGNISNCFDFAVVVGSLLSLAVKGGSLANLARSIRIFRMIRLLRHAFPALPFPSCFQI